MCNGEPRKKEHGSGTSSQAYNYHGWGESALEMIVCTGSNRRIPTRASHGRAEIREVVDAMHGRFVSSGVELSLAHPPIRPRYRIDGHTRH